MKKFKDLSIAQKFFFGSLASSSFLIFCIIFILFGFKKESEYVKTIVDDTMHLNAAATLAESFAEIRVNLNSILIEKELYRRKNRIEQVNVSSKNLTDNIALLIQVENNPTVKKMIADFEYYWNEYQKFFPQYFEYALNFKDNDALSLLFSETNDYRVKLRNLSQKIHDFYIEDTKASFEQIENLKNILYDISLILLIIAIIAAILISKFIASKITKPIYLIFENSKKIANGERISLPIESSDEIGQLCDNLNKISEQIAQAFDDFDKLAAPVMKIDRDFTVEYMNQAGAKLLNKPISEIIGKKCYDLFKTDHCKTEKCSCHIAINHKTACGADNIARPFGKEIPIHYLATPRLNNNGEVIGAIEFVIDITKTKEQEKYLDRSIKHMLERMNKFANGDMTIEVVKEKDGDNIAELFEGFNQSVKALKDLLKSVSENAQTVASASEEISASVQQMAAGAQEQSAQSQEIASAVEEMSKTVLETSKNAVHAANIAKESRKIAENGAEVINRAIISINNIHEVVNNVAEAIKELGKSGEQIGAIIQVIDEIADQTNLLALNAAIEAARAGEQGRGFAVVADEVRKLAERTTKATKEIESMIKKIQSDTSSLVSSIQTGLNEVNNGKKLAESAGDSLSKIMTYFDQTEIAIAQVASASEELSATAEQISASIEQINSVTQQNASGIEQISKSTEDLAGLTFNLQNLISKFKLYSDGELSGKKISRLNEKNERTYQSNAERNNIKGGNGKNGNGNKGSFLSYDGNGNSLLAHAYSNGTTTSNMR